MHNITKIKLFRILLRIIYPFAWLILKPFAHLKKKKNVHLIFLFDRYSMGGAQRIHLDILHALADTPKQLYFTRKSFNTSFKEQFYNLPLTKSRDIHFWCDNLLFRIFTIHFLAFYFNRHENLILFSSNSTLFYDLLPWLKSKSIRRIELLHNFTFGKNGMEYFGLMNHQYLDNRVVYDNFTLQNIKEQYIKYNISSEYLDRILFIEPGVEILAKPFKDFSSKLKILYAGRGGEQKRIHLLDTIAEMCYKQEMSVQFHFAGSMIGELSEYTKAHSVVYGTIDDVKEMYKLYQEANCIIMTSAYEGFPMLIKEAMACGCIPIVTALPGNKTHLINMQNSLLINEFKDESKVIIEGIDRISLLLKNKELANELSNSAYNYAVEHFNKGLFIKQYRQLLS